MITVNDINLLEDGKFSLEENETKIRLKESEGEMAIWKKSVTEGRHVQRP